MKRRVLFTLVFVLLICLLTYSGLIDKLFYIFKAKHTFLQFYSQKYIALGSIVFVLAFILAATLCLPLMSLLMLVAGALFPLSWALILSSLGLTLGACGAFLISRYFLSSTVEKKFGSKLKNFHENFNLHGDYYLMSLRLSPLIPYWMINVFMGLTGIRLWKFYVLTQLGTFVFVVLIVNAGAQIASLDQLSDLLSLKVWISLFLLGFIPLILRYLMIKKSRS